MLHISPESPESLQAGRLLAAHHADLVERYGESRERLDEATEQGQDRDEAMVFLVAWFGGEAAGFARLATSASSDPAAAEITHLFLKPRFRGRRISRELLRKLESHADARGMERLVAAAGERQPEAMALLAGAGYHRIPSSQTGLDPARSLHFEKRLRHDDGVSMASGAGHFPSI